MYPESGRMQKSCNPIHLPQVRPPAIRVLWQFVFAREWANIFYFRPPRYSIFKNAISPSVIS
jgi:hypothetical protein